MTDTTLLRAGAAIGAGNIASRITGFGRVVAVGAVLGTTFLGNTYQTSNLVSNILFELLAAGLLSSVLVPTFVGLLDRGRPDEAEHVAGALLGLALAALGLVTALALVAGTWLMRGLTVAVSDPAVRRQEVHLGAFLLWFFLPQVLLYAVGALATALLHGARRFTAPAFAPVANNVVVMATMGLFWAMRHGATGQHGHAGLDLPLSQRLVLAIGTTAGVLVMTAVPVAAAWRAGLRLRPRWAPRHPQVRALGRAGAWAAAYLALNQLLIATTLVLANRVEGGVVAFQIAFTFFLLPHAVLANPVYTALYPRLASDAGAGRWERFTTDLSEGNRLIAFLVLPGAALLIALGRPVLRVVQTGALDAAGGGLVARVLAAYAIGVVGYAAFQLLTRASYAAGDARAPTLVNLAVTAGGAALMVVLFAASSGGQRVVVLGIAHSVAMVGGAAGLLFALRRRLARAVPVGAALGRGLVCATAAGLSARVVSDAIGASGRLDAGVALLAAGAAGIAVYAGGQWLLRAPELRQLRTGAW